MNWVSIEFLSHLYSLYDSRAIMECNDWVNMTWVPGKVTEVCNSWMIYIYILKAARVYKWPLEISSRLLESFGNDTWSLLRCQQWEGSLRFFAGNALIGEWNNGCNCVPIFISDTWFWWLICWLLVFSLLQKVFFGLHTKWNWFGIFGSCLWFKQIAQQQFVVSVRWGFLRIIKQEKETQEERYLVESPSVWGRVWHLYCVSWVWGLFKFL